jgi:hypothetical protein
MFPKMRNSSCLPSFNKSSLPTSTAGPAQQPMTSTATISTTHDVNNTINIEKATYFISTVFSFLAGNLVSSDQKHNCSECEERQAYASHSTAQQHAGKQAGMQNSYHHW